MALFTFTPESLESPNVTALAAVDGVAVPNDPTTSHVDVPVVTGGEIEVAQGPAVETVQHAPTTPEFVPTTQI